MSRRYVPKLDASQIDEAASHTHALWSGGRDLEAHKTGVQTQLRRAGADILRYVGLVDDQAGLVASIKRHSLVVFVPGGGTAKAVGIGAVFTRPDARGTGAASELLRHVLEEAREAGDVIGLLYSDIDPAFYERFGFVRLESLEVSAPVLSLPSETSLDLRRATPEDEPRMLSWYDAAWDPSFLRVARTLDLLRYFRFRNHVDVAWIVRHDGKDVGYVLAALHDEKRDDGSVQPPRSLWVDEWAVPGFAHAEVHGALRAIAEHEGATNVAGWLPRAHAPFPFVAKPRKTAIPMAVTLTNRISSIDPTKTFFGSLDHF